jgi:hypothetical protein
MALFPADAVVFLPNIPPKKMPRLLIAVAGHWFKFLYRSSIMTDSPTHLRFLDSSSTPRDSQETPAYIRIDLEDVEKIINSDLSAVGIKLFLLTAALDRYGDQGVRVQAAFLRKRLGRHGKLLSKSTYYEEKAKLQTLELVDFSETDVKIRNCAGYKAPERLQRTSDTTTTEAKTEPSSEKRT